MNATQTNLQFVNRDGKPDTAFLISLRKAQAGKYATRLTKRALRGCWFVMARVQSDIEHKSWPMDEYLEHYGLVETEEQATERSRNQVTGQFTRG